MAEPRNDWDEKTAEARRSTSPRTGAEPPAATSTGSSSPTTREKQAAGHSPATNASSEFQNDPDKLRGQPAAAVAGHELLLRRRPRRRLVPRLPLPRSTNARGRDRRPSDLHRRRQDRDAHQAHRGRPSTVNRALLMSTALVTALLIMGGSYLIVRYVIVKPVKHLKEVSDAISRRRAERPQRNPDRRRVRGPQPRLQPHAAQPGQHAGPSAQGQRRPRPQGGRAGPGQHGPVRIQPPQERLPGHHEPRAAHAAQQHPRLQRGAAVQRPA